MASRPSFANLLFEMKKNVLGCGQRRKDVGRPDVGAEVDLFWGMPPGSVLQSLRTSPHPIHRRGPGRAQSIAPGVNEQPEGTFGIKARPLWSISN